MASLWGQLSSATPVIVLEWGSVWLEADDVTSPSDSYPLESTLRTTCVILYTIMRSTKLLLLLLVALVTITLTSPIGVEAIAHKKLHQYQAAQKAAAKLQPVKAPLAAAVPPTLAATSSNEIVASLQALLAAKKASGDAARAKLEAAAAHTVAVEQALAEKRVELAQHNEMLHKLEQCLQQGPIVDRAERLEKETLAQQQSLLEAQSTIQQREQLLMEQHEEIQQQQEALETQQHEIADKEMQLKKLEAHLNEQQSLLEKQALEVTQKEKSLENLVAEKVEDGIQDKLAAMRAQMEAESESKLQAVKDAMEKQAQAMMHEHEVLLNEQRAAKIARVHEMHDLTSTNVDSPYAAMDQQLASQSEDVEPALIEM